MKSHQIVRHWFLLLLLPLAFACRQSRQAYDPNLFLNPPVEAGVHIWWHWMNGNITREGITRDLESMHEQGIVQATILNIGLIDLKDTSIDRVVFDTPKWYDMFAWAVSEANRLGITLGVHNCDGWSSSGGKWITPEKSMKQIVWTKMQLEGGKAIQLKLNQPYTVQGYYSDIALLAIPAKDPASRFHLAEKNVGCSPAGHAAYLTDGCPVSAIPFNRGDYVEFAFKESFSCEEVAIHPRRPFMWGDMKSFQTHVSIWTSADGKRFQKNSEHLINGLNQTLRFSIGATKALAYRIQVDDYSRVDEWIPFELAEVELLEAEEYPLYNPKIPGHLVKIAAVRASDEANLHFSAPDEEPALPAALGIINLTEHLSASGELKWQVPYGNWTLIRCGYTSTGAMNSPATLEGQGLECDKLDSTAVGLHFNRFAGKLAARAGKHTGETFRFMLIDSWECGYQNWTGEFPQAFSEQHGYVLTEWLPVLCGETIETAARSEAFLHDFRNTIARLLERNYYGHFSRLCREKGLEMHAEVIYGGSMYPPLDVLKANSYADLQMTEFWAGHNSRTLLPESLPRKEPEPGFPQLAAACYGNPVTGAEAYTGYAHFSESPWELKPFGDKAYCSGINRFILHSYVHQPASNRVWTLGIFASLFNRNNPYWNMSAGWLQYHARIQYLLQKGYRTGQVLQFTGDQLPQQIVTHELYSLPWGYSAGLCNADVLHNRTVVRNGRIVLPSGISYEILALPPQPVMELKTLQRIEKLIRQGAVVYGPRPLRTLTLSGLDENNKQLLILAQKIWGSGETTDRKYGRGRVIWGKPLAQVLNDLQISPEFSAASAGPLDLMYIRKSTDEAEICFVVNQTHENLSTELLFSTDYSYVEVLDPETGMIRVPTGVTRNSGKIGFNCSFVPRGSLLFVFSNRQPHVEPDVSLQSDTVTLNDLHMGLTLKPYGDEDPVILTDVEPGSLTNQIDPRVRYFSGLAEYVIQFTIEPTILTKAEKLMLSSGHPACIAHIVLNDHDLGTQWRSDSEIEVTGILKSTNVLRVTVATELRNRIIGDLTGQLPGTGFATTAVVTDFLSPETPLKPSGLQRKPYVRALFEP